MRRPLSELVTLAFMSFAFSGCCFDPFEGDGTGGGGEGGGSGGGGGRIEDVMVHEQCAGVSEQLSVEAALSALDQAPIADGVQELPISSSGCIVVRREYQAGALRGVSLRKFLGFATIVDGGIPNFVFGEAERVWVDIRLGADGHNVMRADGDADGKVEKTFDEQFSQGKLVSRVVTWFNEANGEVTRRTTLTPSTMASDMMRWRVESGSPLAVTLDIEVPAGQKQTSNCYSPSPNMSGTTVSCPGGEMAVRTRMHEAATAFWQCISALGGGLSPSLDEIFLLRTSLIDDMGLRCFEGTDHVGQMHLDTNVMDINVGMLAGGPLGPCEDKKFVDGTIIHELVHRLRGPHDADWTEISGPIGPRARAGADPAYACEALCFGDGSLRNKCSCARCLSTTACDDRCDGLPSCTVKTDAGYVASEAVGALCQSNDTWFFTKTACNSAGACPLTGGKSSCKSYSVSCDPNCN